MLTLLNLFQSKKKRYHNGSDWGRLHVPEKSSAILCTKTESEDGTCIEKIQSWNNDNVPSNRTITQIQRQECPVTPPKLGTKVVYSAVTPTGGTELTSSGRSYDLSVTTATQEKIIGTVHMLSPERKDINPRIVAPPKVKKKKIKRKLSFEINQQNIDDNVHKGGQTVLVVPNKKSRKKVHSQVSVMGASPNEEWKSFQEFIIQLEKSPEILKKHPKLQIYLTRLQTDPEFRELFITHSKTTVDIFGSEWAHVYFFGGAGGNTFDPQSEENMALAAKWINSFMMTLEKIAYGSAFDKDNQVSIESDFTMLPGTRFVDTIDFKLHAQSPDDSTVDIGYHLPALAPPKRSNCASNSDAMYLHAVARSLLTGEEADCEQTFKVTQDNMLPEKPLQERLRSSKKRKH